MDTPRIPQVSKKGNIRKIDMIGRQFGRLTVIEELDYHIYPSGEKRRRFKCLCECGNHSIVTMNNLRTGKTNSCGCLRDETTKHINYAHGLRKHPLYGVWCNVKTRCYNANTERYKDYGGRGIEMCNEWKNDFSSFYKWAVENGWEKGLLLDRINNDGWYSPDNCRFVNYFVNARNRRLLCSNNTSGFHGVTKQTESNQWGAHIGYNYKQYFLGYFATPKEAAIAYDNKAKEFDSNYPLNFPNN